MSGSDVYVGGSLTSLTSNGTPVPANNVAHYNGRGWSSLGSGAANGTNGKVRAIAVSGANVYVGGDFTGAGGQAAGHVAKWNGTSWSTLGTGVSMTPVSGQVRTETVTALAVSGTTVYVGGTFEKAGGAEAHSVAAWNGTSWSPMAGGVVRCPGGDCSYQSSVNALLVSGTTLYAGGTFDRAGGTGGVQTSGLAAWSGTAWSAVGGSGVKTQFAPGTVNALSSSGAGKLDIGGNFVSVAGVPAQSVAAWDGTTWHALGIGMSFGGQPGTVKGLAAFGGKLYATGQFTDAGGDGQPNVAQWNGTNWTPVGAGLQSSSAGPGPMAAAPGGVVTVGTFDGSGPTVLTNIGLWTGSVWTGFGLGASEGRTLGSLSAVGASGHDLYAGGRFTNVGSTPATNFGRFNGSAWSATASGINGPASAVAISGKQVFVGGQFSSAGTAPATNVAMWDGAAWHALPGPLGSGTDGPVRALLVLNGKLWVGGQFKDAGGVVADNLATYDLTTHVWAKVGGGLGYGGGQVLDDGTFLIDEEDYINASVHALTTSGQYVVIGGTFKGVNDGKAPAVANDLLLFDTTAAITGPFSGYFTFGGLGQSCGAVRCAANTVLSDGGSIYVGGAFNSAGSGAGAVAAHGLARFNFATFKWESPGSVGGGPVGGIVNSVVKTGPSIYVGGNFLTAGGVAAPGIASYTPTTTTTGTWATLGSGLASGPVASLTTSADGVYVGGDFTTAGGKPSQNLALWGVPTPTPTIAGFSPTSGIPGTTKVTVNGTGLNGATSVTFNGIAAGFTTQNATQLTATVPNGATTGRIAVTTAGGTATSAAAFTVPFTITRFTPLAAKAAATVTIVGAGFNASSVVKFNGVAATSTTHSSATQLKSVVPGGATTGPITVTNTTGTVGHVTSPSSFAKL